MSTPDDLRVLAERVIATAGYAEDRTVLAEGYLILLSSLKETEEEKERLRLRNAALDAISKQAVSSLEAAEMESARRLGLIGDAIKQTDQLRTRAEAAEQDRDVAQVEVVHLRGQVRGLEHDLRLNAGMLARQTDMAREAEIGAMAAERERDDARSALASLADVVNQELRGSGEFITQANLGDDLRPLVRVLVDVNRKKQEAAERERDEWKQENNGLIRANNDLRLRADQVRVLVKAMRLARMFLCKVGDGANPHTAEATVLFGVVGAALQPWEEAPDAR